MKAGRYLILRRLFMCQYSREIVNNTCFYSTLRPDFTKNTCDVKRGNYAHLNETHVSYFRNLLGRNHLVTDPETLDRYNVDFFKQYRGNSSIVLKPSTTNEVSKILSYCNENKLAVVPQGGNTGVVGGCTPVFDEIIISTELMNNILHVDEIAGILICEAGCILESLEQYLHEKDLYLPLDLGAKGSCHIGGNVSTNAGGLRVLRYGNLHGNVLGLEAVKADGEIIDCLSALKKDNTGYHLKHLFIGSEGTLGIVTKVAIQCVPKPKALTVAMFGLETFDKILTVFKVAKQNLAETLSAFEMLDTPTMELLYEHQKLKSPIGNYPFYVLMETSGSNAKHDEEKLGRFTEMCFSSGYILNGVISTDYKKYLDLWSLRERIANSFVKDGYVLTYDFTLPLNDYYKLVPEIKKYMGAKSHRVFGFGHLGDGNLHLQVSIKEFDIEIKNYLEPYIFERVKALKGSISAEHGMGLNKSKYLSLSKSNSSVALMKNLKFLLDPNGILNPYKVIPT